MKSINKSEREVSDLKNQPVRIRIINCQLFAKAFYIPGVQKRSYKQLWRVHIYPIMHISYATFMKDLKRDAGLEQLPPDVTAILYRAANEIIGLKRH